MDHHMIITVQRAVRGGGIAASTVTAIFERPASREAGFKLAVEHARDTLGMTADEPLAVLFYDMSPQGDMS